MSKNFLFHILQAICSNNKLLWFKIPFKCKNDQDKREEMISSPPEEADFRRAISFDACGIGQKNFMERLIESSGN